MSSESRNKIESMTESRIKETMQRSEEAKEAVDDFALEAKELDSKLKQTVEESQNAADGFFSRDRKLDAPSGETPARERTRVRLHPREAVEGTPDDERVRRIRQERDLTAAMRLRIEDLEEEEEDGDDDSRDSSSAADASESDRDSVISSSTKMTPSEAGTVATRSRRAATAARGSGDKKSGGKISAASSAYGSQSEEVGYSSDRVRTL